MSGSVINVLLERHQVRRSKEQKQDFETFLREECRATGYALSAEDYPNFLKSRNLIAGDPEKARVIYTAHYDTCAEMPWPNLVYPQRQGLTLLVQMPMVLLMLAIALGIGYGLSAVMNSRAAFLVAYAVYWLLFLLIYFGPANPHTANDNTSGVAALIQIMREMPPELKNQAAFIFFDHEEMGKIGSKQYAKKHPKITEGRLLLNLDCVGDGRDFLVVAPAHADEKLKALLTAAFVPLDGREIVHCGAENTRYNSDQRSFPGGVAAAACQKGRWGYHIPRIHTRRDVICDQSNLDYITRCAVTLAQLQSNE